MSRTQLIKVSWYTPYSYRFDVYHEKTALFTDEAEADKFIGNLVQAYHTLGSPSPADWVCKTILKTGEAYEF
jgi:hypothetical protein